MLGHKTSLNKFKRIEIISSIFSNKCYETRLNNNLLNNNLLKNQWVNEEIKEETRKYLQINENGNATLKTVWDAKTH